MVIGKNVKAFLIDLDGTLADSLPVLYQAYLDFMNYNGLEGNADEFNQLIGPSIPEIVRILCQKYRLNPPPEALVHEYYALIRKNFSSRVGLFPGADEFLRNAKRHGIKVALVTSASTKIAEEFINHHQLNIYFDVIVTSDSVKKTKPHPEIYLKALSLLQLDPSEAVAIEDSPNGIQSALDAGIPTCLITHGSSKASGHEVMMVMSNWQALIDYFKLRDKVSL